MRYRNFPAQALSTVVIAPNRYALPPILGKAFGMELNIYKVNR